MFWAMILTVLGFACVIGMPIAHSVSLLAYQQAQKYGSESDSKLFEKFMGTAGWAQALCYFLGVLGVALVFWAGLLTGEYVANLRQPPEILAPTAVVGDGPES